jgi:hypothetical protein
MEHPPSLLDMRAVDPFHARAVLERLAGRRRETLRLTCILLASSAVLALLRVDTGALSVAAGGVVAGVLYLRTEGSRQELIALLVGQRSAYVIPEIAAAGERYATLPARQALSTALLRLVRAAEGNDLVESVWLQPRRITAHAEQLRQVASLVGQEGVAVHPSTLALLHQLLYHPARSPLFNADVPEQELTILLRRVQLALDTAA